MTFLIIFLKGLLFIICNMGVAFVLVYTVKLILFKPKPFKFFGKEIPITQGYIVRKRNWLLNKLRYLLNDYLNQAGDEAYPDGYLKEWEKNIYDAVNEKIYGMEEISFLPKSWRDKLSNLAAKAVLGLVKQFLRKFVPFLITTYNLHSYIDLIDRKLDIDILIRYFNKYFYRPVLYFFLAISFLIGVGNMILFWILA
jgi:hypothetical protein